MGQPASAAARRAYDGPTRGDPPEEAPMHADLPDRDEPETGLRAPGAFDPWQAFNAGCDVFSASHADAAGISRRAAWRTSDWTSAMWRCFERLRAGATWPPS